MSTLTKKITRRDFLKRAGLGTAALAASLILPGSVKAIYASETTERQAFGILIDLTRCTGCNSCVLACKEAYNLPHPDVIPQELSSDAYTYIDRREVKTLDGRTLIQSSKRQCMHCLHPACVSACTVGALTKKSNGPVVYDAGKCFGCRYCQYACPFAIPTYEWGNPLGMIHKCQFCVNRLVGGQSPVCTTHCPTGALRFGKREALLFQARAQISSNPDRYLNYIYGEHEVGGTSVLYLSAVPFEEMGFPKLGTAPNPRYAEAVMDLTPYTALSVASIATGGHFLAKWREKKTHHLSDQKVDRGDEK